MDYFDIESTESFPRSNSSKFYSKAKIFLVVTLLILLLVFGIGFIVISVKLNSFSMELGKVSRKLQNISIEFETFKTKDDEPKISNVIFDWENTEIAKNISQI